MALSCGHSHDSGADVHSMTARVHEEGFFIDAKKTMLVNRSICATALFFGFE